MTTTYPYAKDTITATTQTPPTPGTIVVADGALVTSAGGDGFDLSSGPWTINLIGAVQSVHNDGISLAASISTKHSVLTVGVEGSLFGADTGIGLESLQAIDVTNSGVIGGGSMGIDIGSAATFATGFSITNQASGSISGIAFGIRNENSALLMTVKNAGEIRGFAAGIGYDGAAMITNSGVIQGGIGTGATTVLASTIINSGTITGIGISDGNDTVKNSGIISGTVNLSGGNNSLTNSKLIGGAVGLGNGNDTVTNSGSIADTIFFGDGNDHLTNSGTIGNGVTFGVGSTVAANTGTITGAVVFGNGNNTLTNGRLIDGDVTMGSGNDHLTNSGTIDGNLTLGGGNDVVSSGGTVTGLIDLGTGNDSFTGGSHVDNVQDNFGADIYKLGAGDDRFHALGEGNLALDGGAGVDQFDATASIFAYHVNLNTSDVTLNGQLMGAQSLLSASLTGGAIKGFEIVYGSTSADLIAGGAAAEFLSGNGGNDFIAGGLGADTITGGGGADAFVYFTTKDSGITRATRDVVLDFTTGTDTIDLTGIDADSKTVGNQIFSWIGTDVVFSHTAGELRALVQGGDTIVQGDVNGDGKADFSIDLTGVQALSSADFNL